MAKSPQKSKSQPAPEEAQQPEAKSPGGKLGVLIELLKRPEGATLEDMMAATGWQKHSVRGAMSGSLKKAKGLTITSVKTESGRSYWLVSLQAADA